MALTFTLTVYITLIILSTIHRSQAQPQSSPRCMPTSVCWPDAATWGSLNATLGGRLVVPRPSASPCYDTGPTATAACQRVRQNWTNPFWRADQPGSMQYNNREATRGSYRATCPLPNDGVKSYPTACTPGEVPAYAVDAAHAGHVASAVEFAARYNILLSIKSTGHDVMGRSTASGSLNIWLHHMSSIQFHSQFIPESCALTPGGMAVAVGPGVQWTQLYAAVHAAGVIVVGGMSGSVSAGGGYLQGGGHSPLSPLYGLAADNVLEITAVTADGRHVTANPCVNPDLFWALRGGGGGTYAVVTSVTYRTYPPFRRILSAGFEARAATSDAFLALAAQVIKLQATLSDAGPWSGYSSFNADLSITGAYILPETEMDDNLALSPFQKLLEYSPRGISVSAQSSSSFSEWHNYVSCNLENPGVCASAMGNNAAIASRLIPKKTIEANDGMVLAHGFLQILEMGQVSTIIGHLVGGRAVAQRDIGDNSVNPAWRTALWHVVTSSTWNDEDEPQVWASKIASVTQANQVLRELTPDSGCYLNEADPNEPEWQQAFFGGNFERLLAIKRKFDPNNLFTCWRCVGSEF